MSKERAMAQITSMPITRWQAQASWTSSTTTCMKLPSVFPYLASTSQRTTTTTVGAAKATLRRKPTQEKQKCRFEVCSKRLSRCPMATLIMYEHVPNSTSLQQRMETSTASGKPPHLQSSISVDRVIEATNDSIQRIPMARAVLPISAPAALFRKKAAAQPAPKLDSCSYQNTNLSRTWIPATFSAQSRSACLGNSTAAAVAFTKQTAKYPPGRRGQTADMN